MWVGPYFLQLALGQLPTEMHAWAHNTNKPSFADDLEPAQSGLQVLVTNPLHGPITSTIMFGRLISIGPLVEQLKKFTHGPKCALADGLEPAHNSLQALVPNPSHGPIASALTFGRSTSIGPSCANAAAWAYNMDKLPLADDLEPAHNNLPFLVPRLSHGPIASAITFGQ